MNPSAACCLPSKHSPSVHTLGNNLFAQIRMDQKSPGQDSHLTGGPGAQGFRTKTKLFEPNSPGLESLLYQLILEPLGQLLHLSGQQFLHTQVKAMLMTSWD